MSGFKKETDPLKLGHTFCGSVSKEYTERAFGPKMSKKPILFSQKKRKHIGSFQSH